MARLLPLCAPLALLLAACAEPKGVAIDPRELIPAGADVAFSFELEAVKNSAFGPLLHAAALTSDDLRPVIAGVPNCQIDLTRMRVTFAGALEASDQKFLGAVESPGIGSEKVVECLEREQAKAAGRSAPGWLAFSTRGDVRTLEQKGGGKLVILNKDTVVFMTGGWEEAVFKVIEQPSKRENNSELLQSVLKLDAQTDAWLVVTIGDVQRAAMPELKGIDGAELLTTTADLSQGVKLALAFDTTAPAKAGELKEGLDTILLGLKLGLEPIGLPPTLLDGAATTVDGDRVTTRIELGADTLPKLLAAAAPLFAQ